MTASFLATATTVQRVATASPACGRASAIVHARTALLACAAASAGAAAGKVLPVPPVLSRVVAPRWGAGSAMATAADPRRGAAGRPEDGPGRSNKWHDRDGCRSRGRQAIEPIVPSVSAEGQVDASRPPSTHGAPAVPVSAAARPPPRPGRAAVQALPAASRKASQEVRRRRGPRRRRVCAHRPAEPATAAQMPSRLHSGALR